MQVGVDDAGILQAVQATLTCDTGYTAVDLSCIMGTRCLPSCYSCANWEVTPQSVLTNTPVNTWCRSNGEFYAVLYQFSTAKFPRSVQSRAKECYLFFPPSPVSLPPVPFTLRLPHSPLKFTHVITHHLWTEKCLFIYCVRFTQWFTEEEVGVLLVISIFWFMYLYFFLWVNVYNWSFLFVVLSGLVEETKK